MQWTELINILKNAKDVEELNGRREEIAGLIPKVRIMFDFDQRHEAHPYDLWMHTLHVIIDLPKSCDDDMLYLGALLHDIGKPFTQRTSDRADGNARHPNHPAEGARIVCQEIMPDLEGKGIFLSDNEKKRLLYYVEHHDDTVGLDVKSINEQRDFGASSLAMFQNLMHLEVSDALAHAQVPYVVRRVETCRALAGEEGKRLWQELQE